MMYQTAAKVLFEKIQKDFKFSLSNRLAIVAEVEMYRKGEDQTLWTQDKEENYVYQVFFDGEFVCFFNIREDVQKVYLRVLKGLLKLYKEKKIHWNKFLYDYDEEGGLLKPKVKKEKVDPKGNGIEHKVITEILNKPKKI